MKRMTFSGIHLTINLYNSVSKPPKVIQKFSFIKCSCETFKSQLPKEVTLFACISTSAVWGAEPRSFIWKVYTVLFIIVVWQFYFHPLCQESHFFPCMKWSGNVALAIRCLWEPWILSFWGMHRVWIRLSHVTKCCISKGVVTKTEHPM